MIKHIVMFKFKPEANGKTAFENATIVKNMLEALQGVVPTLKSSKVSYNSPKASADNYDLVLEAEFESMEALAEYIVHPEHKKIGEFMKDIRDFRACVDYEV